MMRAVEVRFIEPEVNREASEYISKNYNDIYKSVLKMGISENKAGDLLNDVYVSIVEAENNGNGYDFNRSKDGNGITVAEFVHGRVKRYSKNKKYQDGIVEGNGEFEVYAASYGDEDIEELNSMQRALALAHTYDPEIHDIEAELAIRERIEFCLEFQHAVKGVNLIELFKNIDCLAEMNFDKSVFNGLKEAFRIHDEFASAFIEVVEYAKSNSDGLKAMLASY